LARMGEMRNAYRIITVKPEGKRPLGRPSRRWEVVDWMHLVQVKDQWLALVNTVMNLRVPQKLSDYYLLKKDSVPRS